MGQIVNVQHKQCSYINFSTCKQEMVEYVAFIDLAKKDEEREDDLDYVETVSIDGNIIDVYDDDYGQCYMLRYTDADGEEKYWGCGTYNFDYMSEAIAISRHIDRVKEKKETL